MSSASHHSWLAQNMLRILGLAHAALLQHDARRMNQNQRYEVLMHFPGYECACGIHRGEYAAKLLVWVSKDIDVFFENSQLTEPDKVKIA